jgi:RNA 2',3'-cyclic 3'-phosphodiesterase
MPMRRTGANAEEDRTSHRLFFALWPDAGVREAIAATALELDHAHAPGGRAVQPARFHLTLAFLGNRDPAAAIAAGDAVRAVTLDLCLDRAGTFAGNRILWLGMSEVPKALSALSSALTDVPDQLDRDARDQAAFVPHVTLQRNVRRPIAATAIRPLQWTAREFVLVDSIDRTYRVIGQWPLGH